jgi:hypothetical protein
LVALENIVPIAIYILQFHPNSFNIKPPNSREHFKIKRVFLDVPKTLVISTQRRIGTIDSENIIIMNKEEKHIKIAQNLHFFLLGT